LRGPDARGIVERLQGGLAAHAERAQVDRMVGIALGLDRPSLAGAHDDAAARRALGASRCVVERVPRRVLDAIGRNEQRNQLLRLVGAGGDRDGRPTGGQDLEKVPAGNASFHGAGPFRCHLWHVRQSVRFGR
jgi:hypothetical protein